MVIIRDGVESIKKNLKNAKKFAKWALEYKSENKAIADVFERMSENCILMVNSMHDSLVKLIKEYQSKGAEYSKDMMIRWNIHHKEMIEETVKIRQLQDMYKG